jgi:hypothetical protein
MKLLRYYFQCTRRDQQASVSYENVSLTENVELRTTVW